MSDVFLNGYPGVSCPDEKQYSGHMTISTNLILSPNQILDKKRETSIE